MEIIHVIVKDNGLIYGLGRDSKIYRWVHSDGSWEPYWDTRTEEEKQQQKNQFRSGPPKENRAL